MKNGALVLWTMLFSISFVLKCNAANDTVVEKNHKTYELNMDGSFTAISEVLVRLVSEQGAKNSGQIPIAYSESLQSLNVLEAYTILPNGSRLEVAKDKIFTQAAPVAVSAPQFNDLKYKIVVFPEPLAGGKVYFRAAMKQNIAPFPKHVSSFESVPDTIVTESFVVRVSAPLGLALSTDMRGVAGGKLADSNGRAHWEWTFSNKIPRRIEPLEVSSADFGPFIAFSTFTNWSELAKAYSHRAAAQSTVTPEVRALADELTKGISDPKLQAEAIYNWVARSVRYVGVFLGVGGVVPRASADILSSKYGDCKDHSVLLDVLLRAKGIDSTPVLINTATSYKLPSIPLLSAFNHVITYLPQFDLFVDSTSAFTPFGNLPDSAAGKPVLLVNTGTLSRTPSGNPITDSAHDVIRLTIGSNGEVSGSTKVKIAGSMETGLRAWIASIPGVAKNQLVARWLGPKVRASGNYESSDPNDLSKPFVFTATYSIKDAVNLDSPGAFIIPVGLTYSTIHNAMSTGDMGAAARTTSFGCGSDSRTQDIVLNIPETISILALPRDAAFRGKTIIFDATYRQDGRHITVKRKLIRTRARAFCEPEEWDEAMKVRDMLAKDAKAQVLFK